MGTEGTESKATTKLIGDHLSDLIFYLKYHQDSLNEDGRELFKECEKLKNCVDEGETSTDEIIQRWKQISGKIFLLAMSSLLIKEKSQ